MKPDETDLPGVGTKVSLALRDGGRLDVVTRTGGEREVHFFRRGEEEPSFTACLDPADACALGVALCAALDPDRER
jgi:TrkA domain protein